MCEIKNVIVNGRSTKTAFLLKYFKTEAKQFGNTTQKMEKLKG